MKKKSKKVGVPVRKASPSGSARVPSRKNATAPSSRRSDPSRKERHLIYKDALVRFDEHPQSLCGLIDWSVRTILNPAGAAKDVTDTFPELKSICRAGPSGKEAYWWPFNADGFADRRKALLQMIEASAPALRIGSAAKGGSAAKRRTGAKRTTGKPGPKATPNKKK